MPNLQVALGLVTLLFIPSTAQAFTFSTCCVRAKSEIAFISPFPPAPDSQICSQTYSAGLDAATPLYVNYTYCASNCGGMGLSRVRTPREWAAPLVQFILPSVIFSMTIPRRKKIEFDYIFDKERKFTGNAHFDSSIQLLLSLLTFTIIMVPVFVDTIVWISIILAGAGNMLIGALYEAHLDYRVVKYVKSMDTADLDVDNVKVMYKRELLVTVACGNLQLDRESGSPQKTIPRSIALPGPDPPRDGGEKGRSRLLNLLGAQSSFGGAVGSPVLFFLGAFVYTILDLLNNPSSEDAAISLGFGIEWMIIVHVAIMSGCLLASNNPSTSAGIVGSGHEALKHPITPVPTWLTTQRPGDPSQKPSRQCTWDRFSHTFLGWSNSYDTRFQPVSLWGRGINKMRWIRLSGSYLDEEDLSFRSLMVISPLGWFFKVFIPTMFLIVLPPATAAVVAYFTPPTGLGCRSLSFIVYAFCQVVVTLIALIRNAVDDEDSSENRILKRIFTGMGFKLFSALFWFGSLVSSVGAATMQILGVYRNCICYSGANNWWDIKTINPAINVASDTLLQRQSSGYWIWMGITASLFMAVNCYSGWWYQRLIRHRFIDAVKSMYMPPHPSDGKPISDDESQRTSSSAPLREPAEEQLLARDSASLWSYDAQSAIGNQASAALDPNRWSSGSRVVSTVKRVPVGSKAVTTSSRVPVITVSDDSNGEEYEMASRRIPRPRAYT